MNDIEKKKIVEECLRSGVLVHNGLFEEIERKTESSSQVVSPIPSPGVFSNNVRVVFSYEDFVKKRTVQDFVSYFNARFKVIESLLRVRPELQNLTSIARLHPGARVSVIGIIVDRVLTKNEHLCLDLEDRSGKSIRVIITKKCAYYTAARDLPLDQVIGVSGTCGDNVIFADSVLLPDIPLSSSVKKSPDEVYAVVLSDTEFGSKHFMEREFDSFVAWLRGEWGGEEERRVADKVGYLFVVGDVVAGIGVYPKQESELSITDIREQYVVAAGFFSKIPSRIKIIMCAGNHDSVRLSEPQPCLDKDHASPLYALPNVIMVSNPSLVSIHSSADFSGFLVLIYHGGSYPYYCDTVESIRSSGRPVSDRTDLVMRFLLQCRHLAPSHSSALYIPDTRRDFLVIESVPDYILSGHMHKARVANYRGVGLICGSCWQPTTAYQQKLGHNPEPCVVPVLGLHDRTVVLMDFKRPEVNDEGK